MPDSTHVLAERQSIHLSPDAAATFTDALNRPAQVNERLATALLRPAKFSSADVRFYRPTLPDPDKHHRNEFTSSETTLDEWLRRYAGQNRRGITAAVWVIADAKHNVVCYATLSITAFDRSASPASLSGGAPRQVPALLISRLDTDTRVGIVKLLALFGGCEDWSLWRLRPGTRAIGIRSRSSGTRCGCSTVSR